MTILFLCPSNKVHLNNCPIGLFLYKDTLALMTEYSSTPNQRDAYIVSSGEYFWGGTSDPKIRGRLKVTPCKVKKA